MCSWCKECERIRQKEYYQKHKASVKEAHHRYYAEHAREIIERTAIWAKNNPDKTMAAWKKYEANNPEKAIERTKRYQSKHRDRMREAGRRYAKKHPDRILAKTHKRWAKIKGGGGLFTGKEWVDLKTKYDFTCLCCLRKEPEIKLEADHIVPLKKEGSSRIENIQPLCRECNARKSDKHSTDYRPTIDGLWGE